MPQTKHLGQLNTTSFFCRHCLIRPVSFSGGTHPYCDACVRTYNLRSLDCPQPPPPKPPVPQEPLITPQAAARLIVAISGWILFFWAILRR